MTKTIKKIKYSVSKFWNNIIKYFKKIFAIIQQPHMTTMPGELAFFMILSMVPVLTICVYILSLFNITSDSLFVLINDTVPGGIEMIKPLFQGTSIDITLIIFVAWMFYIASNGFNSVIVTSNDIYGIKTVGWFRRRIKALMMTFSFVLMLLIILVVPVWGEKIITLLFEGSIADKILVLYSYLKLPITWLMMFVFIRTIYEFAPDRVRRKSHVNAGALFTSIGWLIVTYIYSYFANNMSNYNILYGTFANVAFLMIWLYFMSLVFVVGMALNHGEEIEKEEFEKTAVLPVISEDVKD